MQTIKKDDMYKSNLAADGLHMDIIWEAGFNKRILPGFLVAAEVAKER